MMLGSLRPASRPTESNRLSDLVFGGGAQRSYSPPQAAYGTVALPVPGMGDGAGNLRGGGKTYGEMTNAELIDAHGTLASIGNVVGFGTPQNAKQGLARLGTSLMVPAPARLALGALHAVGERDLNNQMHDRAEKGDFGLHEVTPEKEEAVAHSIMNSSKYNGMQMVGRNQTYGKGGPMQSAAQILESIQNGTGYNWQDMARQQEAMQRQKEAEAQAERDRQAQDRQTNGHAHATQMGNISTLSDSDYSGFGGRSDADMSGGHDNENLM